MDSWQCGSFAELLVLSENLLVYESCILTFLNYITV